MKVKFNLTGIGELVVDTDAECLIGDIDEGQETIAARIAWAAVLHGAAVADARRADSHYRAWLARLKEEMAQRDPKAAEWKVKQRAEAHPDFLKYKEAIARAEEADVVLDGLCRALQAKSNQLQSRGAKLRSEFEATGMKTTAAPEVADRMRETQWRRRGRRTEESEE